MLLTLSAGALKGPLSNNHIYLEVYSSNSTNNTQPTLTSIRLPPLRIPIIVAAVLLPRGRRVDVLSVLVRLPLPLPLPLRFADRVPIRVVVPVVVAQRVAIRVVA